MNLILKGGQWQNGTRAGALWIDTRYIERELVSLPPHNEDWDDLPQRWLAIMRVANARVWETEALRRGMRKNERRNMGM